MAIFFFLVDAVFRRDENSSEQLKNNFLSFHNVNCKFY